MITVQFIPGAIATPNPHTLPVGAPNLATVLGAEIERIPNALGAHAAGVAVAHAATAVPVVHGGTAVGAHAFTQPGAHLMTLIGPVGGGGAVTLNNGAALEVAGGPFTDGGLTISAHVGGAVDTHVAAGITQPNNHAAADIVAAVADHAAAAVAAGLANHVGADPVVAAVATRITIRTFSLNVNTLVGDLLTLAYLEVGERILVS